MSETPDYETLNRNLDEKIGAGIVLIGEGISRLQTANAEMLRSLELIANYDGDMPAGYMRTLAEAAIMRARARQP